MASASPQLDLGARLYLDNCNACHFTDGHANSLVTAAEPGGLISVILNGDAMPSTESRPGRLAMPGFGWRLKDDEVAALATFVRKSWSNDAPAVTAEDVAKLRNAMREGIEARPPLGA